MTAGTLDTGTLLTLDLLVAVLVTAAWLGAGAAAALRRPRVAGLLLIAAVTATLTQIASVLALAGAGWWFAAEKLTLGMPLVVLTAAGAAGLAGPALLGALRSADATPAPTPAPAPGGPEPAAPPGALPVRVVVAPLTAGYAGAAGLAVGYGFGYPLEAGVALVAVSLVAAAGLLTWRALRPAGDRGGGARARAAAAGAALLCAAGVAAAFLPAPDLDLGGGPAAATPAGDLVPVSALRGPEQPAPGGQVRRHELTAQRASVRLGSGRTIAAWTFNGQVPGPPITAVAGDLIEVRLRNADIEPGVTLHWHGYDLPSGEDGAPGLTQPPVLPGEEFVYRFVADQVGTYWYHTHSVSDEGVRKGLYGTLVVTPAPSEVSTVDMTVPVHTFEGVTVVGVEDRPTTHRVAAGAPVRLRLLNTDDTPRRLALAGTAFRVPAIDGRDVHGPADLHQVAVRLPAGGRYDLAFTMPERPVALLVDAGGAGSGEADGAGLRLLPEAGPDGAAPAAPDTSGWPELDPLAYGAPAATPFGAGSDFDRDFELVLDRGLAIVDGAPAYAHTVNGRGYPHIPTPLVAEGDLVRFTVVNRSLQTHPWHLHGHSVLVLSRDGEPPTGSPLWLDTFDVRPGEVWRVGFRADNPGLWMNHCHNLPHAEQGMMLHLVYDGVAPYQGPAAHH